MHLNIATGGTQCIGAWRMRPQGTPLAGLVVIQEVFGVNDHIRDVVGQFAANGFDTIAPALFDHVETGVELGYDRAGLDTGLALATETGLDRAVAAVASAAEAISSAGRIGVVGYCWGGTVAFLANTRLGLPAVSYYGGRTVPLLASERPQAPLMLHFGRHDAHIPPADVDKHRAALPQAQIHLYDAGHGFNCDQRPDFNAPAARQAMARTLDFFRSHLT